MNKNKLIAIALDSIANQMKYIADLLDQPDKVTASTKSNDFADPLNVPATTKGKWESLGKGQGVKFTPSGLTAAGIARKGPPIATENWKDQMTAEINDNNRKAVEASKSTYPPGVLSTVIPTNIVGQSVKEFFVSGQIAVVTRDTKKVFYKIIVGVDRGAVIVANLKTGKIVRDGRMNRNTKSNDQLVLVSKDADGINYAKVVRGILRSRGFDAKQSQLVRYYRPVAAGGPNYKMSVLYRKNRNGSW